MLVTKHAAELCALLVSDLCGELPSRILAALFTKGPSNVGQLAQYTSLGLKHIRHGLGVLVQQNLLYHQTNPESRLTSYDANVDACYNLVRSGKVLEVVESRYGSDERELVQLLLLSGHAKIADLTAAFESRRSKTKGPANGTNGAHEEGIYSTGHFIMVLARLIQAEIIETIRPESFRNPLDVFRDIESQIMNSKVGEKTTAKTKSEQHFQAMERYRTFQDQRRALKRSLDQAGHSLNKRRKLQNGQTTNGNQGYDDKPQLSPNVIVRLNHEKCCVELRNQRLSAAASDALGEVTGEVYRTLLELLTTQLSSCRVDPLLKEISTLPNLSVTTLDIFDNLDDGLNVSSGIGKAPKDQIDYQSAEMVLPAAADSDNESEDEDNATAPRGGSAVNVVEDDESEESDDDAPRRQPMSRLNGKRHTKVKFDDQLDTKDDRLEQMRQHLLLLAESKQKFVRHCGTNGRGQWTVDFDHLLDRLRASEVDAFVEKSFGRHGLRLTRILREKGKLDEKMLPAAALMKKSEVQEKMLAMQMAGLVDVQEVPKDSSRMANRTLFFWYFDAERTQAQLLDDIYKAMLRCLQTLQVERHRERSILSFVERKDVQGQEEEVMTAEHYNKYNRHLEVQDKLLGQVMRLDDMVAVLRDY